MGFLNKIFGKQDSVINNYQDFWDWFDKNKKEFHGIVATKDANLIEKKFFPALAAKLAQLNDGIFYLTGMADPLTAELVLTADGNPRNIVFVEELADSAPTMPGWLITKLKQPSQGFGVRMNGHTYDLDNLSFYPNAHEEMPDLIDITIVHEAFASGDDSANSGAYIFLDNFLGELNFVSQIDELTFRGPNHAEKPTIPMENLPNFLETQQALFVEKYDGVRVSTESDSYSLMRGTDRDGMPLFATINNDLLGWDKKASHPWMMVVSLDYDGSSNNGLPDNTTAEMLNDFEHALLEQLRDADGYLNIGRQASSNRRDIFFACIDFRLPAKVAVQVAKSKKHLGFDYQIFKDKYWQSVSHFAERG